MECKALFNASPSNIFRISSTIEWYSMQPLLIRFVLTIHLILLVRHFYNCFLYWKNLETAIFLHSEIVHFQKLVGNFIFIWYNVPSEKLQMVQEHISTICSPCYELGIGKLSTTYLPYNISITVRKSFLKPGSLSKKYSILYGNVN